MNLLRILVWGAVCLLGHVMTGFCSAKEAECLIPITNGAAVASMAFAPDGILFCDVAPKDLRVFDVKGSAAKELNRHQGYLWPRAFGFTAQEGYFFTWGRILTVSLSDYRVTSTRNIPMNSDTYFVASFATPAMTFFAYNKKSAMLEEWSYPQAKKISEAKFPDCNVNQHIAFNADGSRMLIMRALTDKSGVVMETRTGATVGSFPLNGDFSNCSLYDDGKATLSFEHSKKNTFLVATDLKSGATQDIMGLMSKYRGAVDPLISPDGAFLFCATANAEKSKQATEKIGPGDNKNKPGADKGSKAASSSSEALIMNLRTNTVVKAIPLKSTHSFGVFSPDSKFIAVSDEQSFIQVVKLQ